MSEETIVRAIDMEISLPNLPVACTLGPEALAARRQGLLSDLARRVETHEELPDGYRLSFMASDDTLAVIMKTIQAERQCCRFLRFQITVEPAGGPVLVELTGPPGTREFIAALFER
jgi:hypothetical protein